MAKFRYSKEVLEEIYKNYKNTGSLQQTSDWCLDNLGVKTNRHRLSKEFRKQGWDVKPPNGRSVIYKPNVDYRTPESTYISKMIEYVVDDIKNYKNGNEYIINYMSACNFIYSERWKYYISVLSKYARDARLHPNLEIRGVSPLDISVGKDLYNRAYKKLVYYITYE